ncbi:divergent protein kinase domain 2A [Leptopilina heterotoma]|uniref:divergent protein kinase domain 2A n=1 Tax=Leptopilina heterotoma TaxID=63436 RepID=UPI001CA85C75|nr:divergent protein kinase domain 2A [Leptopilina heterotoma]XP_043476259.1 divergent protein kinase domain 2A [Leptopilina heterotoma]XP_043476260.1 divergent protein kinase domain 2A [Leptopilina heterotoma]
MFISFYLIIIYVLLFKLLKLKYFIIASLVVSLSILISCLNTLENVMKTKHTEKCPFCYGLTACYLMDVNELTFDHSDLSSLFSNYLGTKNVYFVNAGNERLVLKQLASDSELEQFDEISTVFREAIDVDFLDLIKESVSTNMSDSTSKLRLCPTTKNMELLLKNEIDNEHFSYKYIWTLVKVNPEPLMLQILPARLGWPVPKYYGACGRLIVEEFVGPVLSKFYNELWILRAEIASSLLNAAHALTFQDENFAFYLTDVSFDNIAVDSNNTAKFIDLENVIVVDKHTSVTDQFETLKTVHKSDSDFGCDDCLIFSPADICAHQVSDHNYYAICKHILARKMTERQISDGLLHDVPDSILSRYPILLNLAKKCSNSDTLSSRITSGIRLNSLLKAIVRTQI